MAYQPTEEIIERYAKVFVRFALNGGEGIRPGETVRLTGNEATKPLFIATRDEVLRAGGHVIQQYVPADASRSFYECSSVEQLSHFPRAYMKGIADEIDHQITIFGQNGLHELQGISPEKLMASGKSVRPYRKWLEQKEADGRFSWTLGLYGTQGMAKEARMSLADYWQQIINACFLDDDDPVRRWRETTREIERLKRKLDRLEIDSLHVEGDHVDLTVGIGPGRRWLGGSGRNIPSFEVFISPDYRRTEGTATFSEPLYRYGSLIKGISLRFSGGEIVEAEAEQNGELLHKMIDSDNGARRIGEFSLTDGRLSRISRFMAETLYDENRGGPQGNFHIAVGNAYKDAYPGNPSAVRAAEWRRLGYNESSVHTDLISTERRTVTAKLASGRTKIIYSDGQFCL